MKLYYSQGACSLSPHIALAEAGAEFELVKVGRDKQTSAFRRPGWLRRTGPSNEFECFRTGPDKF